MTAVELLVQYNPWWLEKVVPERFLGNRRRPLLVKIQENLANRWAILIYGLRRVGKTTIFYQVIQYLIAGGLDPEDILYYSFDEGPVEIKDLVRLYEEKVLKERISRRSKIYFFFDEVQKLDGWPEKIKVLYDLNPNLKVFLSGSASVSLRGRSQESLAGRILAYRLDPLTFGEFLDWKGIVFESKRLEIYSREILPQLHDYLRKGGFPEIVSESDDELIRNYLKNSILERIVFRDLPLEFGLKDAELLRALLELFCREPGRMINLESLARDLGRHKLTLTNYISYLNYALLLREVKNWRPGFLVSSRKGKKIYPASPAFSFAYRGDFYADSFLPKVAETAVAAKLDAQNYFRNSFEVDFVLKRGEEILPVEVKQGRAEIKQLEKFLTKFNLPKGILVGGSDSPVSQRIEVLPLWRFLLEEI